MERCYKLWKTLKEVERQSFLDDEEKQVLTYWEFQGCCLLPHAYDSWFIYLLIFCGLKEFDWIFLIIFIILNLN